MAESEKSTRRPRAAQAAPDQPPDQPAPGQQDQPPDQPDQQQDPPPLADDEYPVERLMSDDSHALVGAPPQEVAGALDLAGIDSENVTEDQVAQALEAYRSHTVYDSTHLPPEGQEG